jgi:hypothetical protein
MTYVRLTRDEWRVEQNFGYGYGDGWEEVCVEETHAEGRARLREYRENQPEYPARLRKVRVPLAQEAPA